MDATTGTGRRGTWIYALGLIISLLGCQPRVYDAPPLPLPPPLPPASGLPQPARPTYYVTINQLNLRACPGIDSPKISTLELNTEVEKMGETENWTQIRVKKNGAIGYVSSRYLSAQPVNVAQPSKKKTRQTKPRKATPPPEAVADEAESEPQKQEPSPPLPRIM